MKKVLSQCKKMHLIDRMNATKVQTNDKIVQKVSVFSFWDDFNTDCLNKNVYLLILCYRLMVCLSYRYMKNVLCTYGIKTDWNDKPW